MGAGENVQAEAAEGSSPAEEGPAGSNLGST